ncbi:hypothetical protein Q5752_004041 [Cryptotrichosporon argae]
MSVLPTWTTSKWTLLERAGFQLIREEKYSAIGFVDDIPNVRAMMEGTVTEPYYDDYFIRYCKTLRLSACVAIIVDLPTAIRCTALASHLLAAHVDPSAPSPSDPTRTRIDTIPPCTAWQFLHHVWRMVVAIRRAQGARATRTEWTLWLDSLDSPAATIRPATAGLNISRRGAGAAPSVRGPFANGGVCLCGARMICDCELAGANACCCVPGAGAACASGKIHDLTEPRWWMR